MSRGRVAVIRCLIVAAVLGITAGPAYADTPPDSYFGVHYGPVADGTWPDAPFGHIRLWDTGTTWADIQPERDVWDWTRLDAAVANAQTHGATISLVLGQTPLWASAFAGQPEFSASALDDSPTSLDDWWVYVNTVATRYRGRIESYEVWNEPNITGYWVGSITRLTALARVARAAVKAADPAALLVSPSPVLRGRYGDGWIRTYAQAGGYRWADRVGVHMYPTINATVEATMADYDGVQALLASLGVRKPMWDTETNMETNTTAAAAALDTRTQMSTVARYYLLAWTHNVKQVTWYDWSATGNIGVKLAAASGSPRASNAGQAFTQIRAWMTGDVSPCRVSQAGVYRCRVATGVVKWHPGGPARVTIPDGASVRETLGGNRVTVGGRYGRVSGSPVLFR